ncbi:MAG: SWIM zinc finger family protein [Candidatus Hodarchaeota archaeon]
MVLEQLYYAKASSIIRDQLLFEPEISRKATFIEANLVDPALTIESFYRLFRVVKIRKGRAALSETILYDPIITVEDECVRFETFSYDVANYACLTLDSSAFSGINQWERGQTNVDFTPDFINALRNSPLGSVKSIKVNPDSFNVITDDSEIIEKKVELPENWKVALDNLREYMVPADSHNKLKDLAVFVRETPFSPYVKKYAELEEGWIPREGWRFIRMSLRGGLGEITFGKTDNEILRFDGRQNPKYEAIRDNRMLRLLKSYLLQVTQRYGNVWEVQGGGRSHMVQKKGASYTCDCKDNRYGNTTCKHVRAVLKPKVRVFPVSKDEWNVITRSTKGLDKHTVTFSDMHFQCTCKEFLATNICQHIVEILEVEEDFQYDELKQDLS